MLYQVTLDSSIRNQAFIAPLRAHSKEMDERVFTAGNSFKGEVPLSAGIAQAGHVLDLNLGPS